MGGFFAGIEYKVLAFAAKELGVLVKDELDILDHAISHLLAAIKGGRHWEEALTATLNEFYNSEVTEGKKVSMAFLRFIGQLSHNLI